MLSNPCRDTSMLEGSDPPEPFMIFPVTIPRVAVVGTVEVMLVVDTWVGVAAAGGLTVGLPVAWVEGAGYAVWAAASWVPGPGYAARMAGEKLKKRI